ncbi:MAG: ABC transporter permease [Candidatus Gastranaerophilales bacterium]|nr:ABC transporter permease [Candidatus Gastranaerophilales bacterium]
MMKFLSIIKDEYKNFLADTGVLLIMIAAVVAYAFWYVMPYQQEVMKEIPVGVVDLDNSDFSRDYVRDLNITDVLKIKKRSMSIHDAEIAFYKDEIRGFVVIPKDFEKDLLKGKQVNVSLYGDSAYLIVYKTLYAAVAQTSIATGGKIEVAKMMKQGLKKKQALTVKQPFEFVQVPLFNPVGGYKSYVYPVILVMILHQTMILGLGLMQGTRNEKKKKYCKNAKDLPLTLFARSTFYVLLYLLYGLVAFFIFPELFVYPMHYNPVPLLGIYILMLYTVCFFAQTISYFFRIREAALLVMVVTSLVFIFIPGLIWPRESIPAFINIFSFFIPATCGIDGIIKINQNGAGFINIIYDYLWLMFLCLLYFGSAILLTKKSDDSFDK